MPVEDGVGVSEWTATKLQHLGSILEIHTRITQAVLSKHKYFNQVYHFVDATAGPGLYLFTTEPMRGSPLLFLDAVEKTQLEYKADLIEVEEENTKRLENSLPLIHRARISLHCCDYAQAVRQILGSREEDRLGLFYIDPTTGIPDFDTLAFVAEARPRMEILVHLSATNLKREPDPRSLSDRMDSIAKRHWLVRKPISGDRHQWTFLLGSNSDLFKDYGKIDFFRIKSQQAVQFFPRLDLSSRQRQQRLQPPLFDLDET